MFIIRNRNHMKMAQGEKNFHLMCQKCLIDLIHQRISKLMEFHGGTVIFQVLHNYCLEEASASDFVN